MKILALETSLRQGSLAALEQVGDQLTVRRQEALPCDQRTAQSLVPAMDRLTSECRWKPAEIDLVAVTTGPGSFTGLRIGVTTAKSLAYATGAQLVGIHTLTAIAANLVGDGRPVWAAMDAQRGELFVARFDQVTWERLAEVPETQVLSVDDWCSRLQPGELVAGPSLSGLAERLPQSVVVADPDKSQPSAVMVGQLAYRLWQQGRTIDPMQLVPHYFRKSAAEEKAARR